MKDVTEEKGAVYLSPEIVCFDVAPAVVCVSPGASEDIWYEQW